jgi:hypothetical protein
VEGEMADEISLEAYWNRINLRLQGNKPNRWIKLSEAVRIIGEKLNEEASEAREVLHNQALPPAVPWVGVVRAWWEDGNRAAAIEIRRELLIRAQIDLIADIILLENEYRTSEYDSYCVSIKYDNFYVEQNHLEAWLEKKRRSAQLKPASDEMEEVSGRRELGKADTKSRNEAWKGRALALLEEKPNRTHSRIAEIIAVESGCDAKTVRRILPPLAELKKQRQASLREK